MEWSKGGVDSKKINRPSYSPSLVARQSCRRRRRRRHRRSCTPPRRVAILARPFIQFLREILIFTLVPGIIRSVVRRLFHILGIVRRASE